MELSRTVALGACVIGVALCAGYALAEPDSRTHARALAARATEEHARLKDAEPRRSETKRKEPERRCTIKPVMSDGEIQECRVVYRYDPPKRKDQ
jgi:hypothetical protein